MIFEALYAKMVQKEGATMKKAKIAIVSLGHSIYFQQFEGLREELMAKSAQFGAYLTPGSCDVVDIGYIDCAESAFAAVRALKKEDADLLFVLLSTYVPSAVCAHHHHLHNAW